jgi:type IV pilus assembly protein PilA
MLKMLRNRIQDDKGFTLIELMVVVLIIAILIAIAIPTFLGLRERAQDRAAQAELRDALTAAKAFYTDNNSYLTPVAFDAAEGAAIEPSLEWNDLAAAVEGAISVRTTADEDEVVVATLSETGTVFCMGDNDGVNMSGTQDAADPDNCTGGF